MLTVSLVAVGVRCDHERPGADTTAPGSVEASEVQAAGTGSGAGGAGADSRPGAGGPPADARESAPEPPEPDGQAAAPRPDYAAPTAAPATTPDPPSTSLSPSPRPARTSKAGKRPDGPRPLPRSRATRLAIPYISVDSPLMDLHLDGERRLPAPPEDKPNLVGWYADGPSPGEQGTAIAVGHLDTDTGPAVFGGLGELKRGKRIEIRRADGRTAVYKVDAIKTYEKDKFPNREVYGARARPELRLITCGGNYNRRTGYTGNVVVYAHLTATREPKGAGRR